MKLGSNQSWLDLMCRLQTSLMTQPVSQRGSSIKVYRRKIKDSPDAIEIAPIKLHNRTFKVQTGGFSFGFRGSYLGRQYTQKLKPSEAALRLNRSRARAASARNDLRSEIRKKGDIKTNVVPVDRVSLARLNESQRLESEILIEKFLRDALKKRDNVRDSKPDPNNSVENTPYKDIVVRTSDNPIVASRLAAFNAAEAAAARLQKRQSLTDLAEVAADEAVELGKSLSTDESSGYINGVIGRIIKIKDSIAI
jgi:hypothetical protein